MVTKTKGLADFLKKKRFYSEFEAHKNVKNKSFFRDDGGIYILYGSGSHKIKVYVEQFYSELEKLIIEKTKKGMRLKRQLMNKRRSFRQMKNDFFTLALLDIELIFLHSLHQGFEVQKIIPVSYIPEWLQVKVYTEFTNVIIECLELDETPLGVISSLASLYHKQEKEPKNVIQKNHAI